MTVNDEHYLRKFVTIFTENLIERVQPVVRIIPHNITYYCITTDQCKGNLRPLCFFSVIASNEINTSIT